MTVSNIANCAAVRAPNITQLIYRHIKKKCAIKNNKQADRGPNPVMQSFLKPMSRAIRTKRVLIDPSPPAPLSLLMSERRVSAGWDMIAAATPAKTPDESASAIFPPSVISDGFVPGK
ncbi:hypothetical protein Zmor_004460 [Zophobas morio]|uniref:Uncharacterized protein n=1 Tax=Zophobas morio TaxID=2755281 RepID=A0AA38M0V8_9CUCU|nr:hypothetical protein Zmor_004460 [Zophobas morio]